MKKQQELKEQRDYVRNPRRWNEFDVEHRGDLGDFEPTLTKQSDAAACDINLIMARYEKTGQLPAMIRENPQYGDFSDVGSFHEAMQIVSHANAQFYALDARVREYFSNDPAKMLKFVEEAGEDAEKGKKLIEMGLALAPQESAADVLKQIRDNTKPVKQPKKAKGDASDDEA